MNRSLRSLVFSCAFMCLLAAAPASAQTCATIQDGSLVNSAGEPLAPGYDSWGYNYQARMFNGTYCDAYRDAQWCQPWAAEELIMKWNDAWLSNQDCDGDGKLDRHHGHATYRGSGAWLTNHTSGTYENPDNPARTCRWTYFVKIVAAPSDATLIPSGDPAVPGVWQDGSGDEIGPEIWGEFAIVEEVVNDPCAGENGIAYKGVRPALGNWGSDPDNTAVGNQ